MQVVACEGGVALKSWSDPPASVVVPVVVEGQRVCAVLEGCFCDCIFLRDFRFEDGSCVKKIEKNAFKGCSSLRSFVWPRGVDTIPERCFCGCQSLGDFRFEDASCVKKIEREAFVECSSLCSFVWPRGVDKIPEKCFCVCQSLGDFRFEDASCVKQIEKWAFTGCRSLCSFVWPCGVDTIPEFCFCGCQSLGDFRFEDGSCVKKIDREAFSWCSSLCSFVWPRGVDKIPERCFCWCQSLGDFRFEDGSCVKKIEKGAFRKCSSLSTFCLPQSLEFIGAGCFSECGSLRTVVLERGTKLGREEFKDAGLGSGVEVVFSEKQRKTKPLSDFLIDLSFLERQSSPSHLVSGGTGHIKLFKRKGDGKLVVGKFLDSDDSGISQKTFEREISNLIALDHPCVVTLVGYALPCKLTKHRFAVFTEYVSGGSLSDAICALCSPGRGCPWFNSTARATIVVGLVHCMKYVHSLGIIHRDLKPSNVLLDEEHRPLVCDFGSSRVLSGDLTLTQSPQLTLYYAAPEFGDEDVAYDSKVDVYSFGVMLYEIVTGQLALRHLNQYQVLPFILRGKRPVIPDEVLPFTRSLITRCWSGDPSERPSFSEICSELWKHNFRIFEDVDSGAVASYARSLPQ